MSLAPGDTFAGYRIVAPLPSESEDEVYLVSHPQSLRDEVLRVFGPNTEISLRNNWFFDAPQVITTSVTPDVGLARLSATGLDDDRGLWVASQFAEGRTASALLAERGRLDVADVITWTGMVADALDALHQRSRQRRRSVYLHQRLGYEHGGDVGRTGQRVVPRTRAVD